MRSGRCRSSPCSAIVGARGRRADTGRRRDRDAPAGRRRLRSRGGARERSRGAPAPLAALHDAGQPAARRRRRRRSRRALRALRGHPVVVNKWALLVRALPRRVPDLPARSRPSAARRSPSSASTRATTADAAERSSTSYPVPYPSYEDPDEEIARALGAPANFPITVFSTRERRARSSSTRAATARSADLDADIDRAPRRRLRSASTRSRACKAIVAGDRADAPGRRASPSTRAGADRPRDRPVPRGPRGPHAARGLRGAARRRRGRHARAGPCASCPTSTRRCSPDAPGRRARRQPATCSPPSRRAGAHEVIVNAPDPVSVARRPRAGAGRRRRWTSGASACARTRSAACVHLIVNERREAGASLPHTHAQLYALDFVPPAIARERERFGAYAVAHDGRQPARRPRPGGGPPARARSSRSTTRRCCWRPTPRGCPTS